MPPLSQHIGPEKVFISDNNNNNSNMNLLNVQGACLSAYYVLYHIISKESIRGLLASTAKVIKDNLDSSGSC